jgi:hypothetical protein
LRGIHDDVKQSSSFAALNGGIASKTLMKLGRRLERYNDKQLGRNNDVSARFLAEFTTNTRAAEEMALVESLATSAVDAQALANNLATIRALLQERMATMQQAVLDKPEFQRIVQLFDDVSDQLKLRLVPETSEEQGEGETGAKVSMQFREDKSAASDNDNNVGDVAAPVNDVGEAVDEEVEGEFANKTPTSSPTPPPVTPAPTGPPSKKDFPEIDQVELITFIIFLLGFPSCVIISGVGMCLTFALGLFECEVLVTPPPGKEEFCDDFNQDDSKLAL